MSGVILGSLIVVLILAGPGLLVAWFFDRPRSMKMNRYTVELSDRKRMELVTTPSPQDAVEAAMGSRLRHSRLDATYDNGKLHVFECTTTDLAKVRAYVRIREDS